MLTRYTAWANERLYESLSVLSLALLNQPRPGRPTGLSGTLGHAYVVDLIWKAHLEGKEHGFSSRSLEPPLAFAELQSAQLAVDQWYIGHADAQTEATLAQIISFKFVDGGAGALSRSDILLHIVNHKTYHRGYVADMLYESGSRPPTIDLPVFIRDAPPHL
jgi:uncharacterized damage-inducible protein DinB